MMALGRAGIGATVVLLVPGALIASALRLRFNTLITWAAVPVFSLAAVFVLGEITDLMQVPFGVPAFVALVAALAVGALAARRIRRRGATEGDVGPQDTMGPARCDQNRPERLVAYSLLASSVAISALTWARGLRGVALGPAGNDGSHHAFFVARIVNTGTIDLSEIVVTDPLGQFRATKFYPLGTHASAAIATRLVGADIGRMLIVFLVLFAAVVLPVGMFVLARLLAPHRPLVAGFTALIVPALTIFPYAPSTWGGIALIVGMAMVPVSVVLVTQVVLSGGPSARAYPRFVLSLAPAALALFAALSVHTTQLPLIVFLAVLVVLERAWRKGVHTVLRAFSRLGAAMLLMAVLFAPALVSAGGGVSERSAINPAPVESLGDVLDPILTLHLRTPARQGALAALALLGACIWVIATRRVAWLIGWVAILVLTLLASVSKDALSQTLTLPWYHLPQRVNYNQAFFVSFFAAVPLALAVTGAIRLLRSPRWYVPATAMAAAALIAGVSLQGYRTSRAMVNSAYAVQGVRPASLVAYDWLAHRSQPRDTVINDSETDGSLWMYPHAQLNPLFGFPMYSTAVTKTSEADRRQRLFLRDNLTSLGRDPLVDAAARALRARWIYIDERIFPAAERTLKIDVLRRNPHIAEVFHRQRVHVFKIRLGRTEGDDVPPMTTIVLPRDTSPASSVSGTLLLTASAQDDVRLAKVEFHVGTALSDRLIGTARATYVGWFYEWDTRSLLNGTYTVTSIAFDASGNSSRSAGTTIVIQN